MAELHGPRWRAWAAVLLPFVLGIVILAARNPDPLLNPAVYAEDGVWVGAALRNGWLHTLVEAKTEYFVFGNILLLFVAAKLSWVVTGSDLTLLPETIALVSYALLSALATASYVLTRGLADRPTRIVLFLLLVLVPLGTTQNEIIGRLVQVGFFVPFATVLLVLSRERRVSTAAVWAHDIGLFVCAGTNPMIGPVLLSYLAWTFWKERSQGTWMRRNAFLLATLVVLMGCLLPRLGGKGGLPEVFAPSGVVAAVLARPIAFPFVFPLYSWFSDWTAVAFTLLWATALGVSWRMAPSAVARRSIAIALVVFALQDLATIVLRPGVTEILAGYETSFPDRYFVGMNVLVVFATMLAIGQLSASAEGRWRSLARAALVAIGILYLVSLPLLFEGRTPRYPIRVGPTFPEQLCAAATTPDGATAVVRIYPDPWTMLVPAAEVKDRCGKGTGFLERLRSPVP